MSQPGADQASDHLEFAACIITQAADADALRHLLQVMSDSGIQHRAVWLNAPVDPKMEEILQQSQATQLGDGHNVGIGRALNGFAQWAQSVDVQAAVAFDQDSLITCQDLRALLETFKVLRQTSATPIAAVGPRLVDARSGQPLVHFKPYGLFRQPIHFKQGAHGEAHSADHLITSAMVFDLRAYEAIGAFSEDYFIDLIDIEWCLRARHRGFELVVTARAVLRQSIGRQTKRLLGRAVFVHAPARNFTLIRNSIWMARFAPMSFGRRVNEWGHLVMRIAHLLLAGDQRRDRACQILRGIRAGMGSKPRQ
ncbi:hypothetical protein GH816_03110 [Betaproteobacteria bacterium LSUCC0115]|nr:hypothetical protein [Burkholderiales bacterium LSUCC0115]